MLLRAGAAQEPGPGVQVGGPADQISYASLALRYHGLVMRGHHATQCNGHARRAAGQRIPIRPLKPPVSKMDRKTRWQSVRDLDGASRLKLASLIQVYLGRRRRSLVSARRAICFLELRLLGLSVLAHSIHASCLTLAFDLSNRRPLRFARIGTFACKRRQTKQRERSRRASSGPWVRVRQASLT